MEYLKKYGKVQASSLLESVVALSIISVCLFIALMVYANAYAYNSSAKYYSTQNKINEAFFLLQIAHDSLTEKYNNDDWQIEEDKAFELRKISIEYKDSIYKYPGKSFYINE